MYNTREVTIRFGKSSRIQEVRVDEAGGRLILHIASEDLPKELYESLREILGPFSEMAFEEIWRLSVLATIKDVIE
jgi:hypothetical protein